MEQKTYINGFDGIRAIAVTMVVLNHIGSFELLPQESIFYTQRLWHLFSGETGVMIFFTLSGFLITHLLITEYRTKGSINYKNFIIRRALRLIPAFAVMMLVYLILVASGFLQTNAIAVTLSFTYLYNYIPQKYNLTELTHTWSLAVEEQFYLVWPLFLKFFRTNKVTGILFIIIFLGVLFTYVLPYLIFEYNGNSYALSESFRPMRWIIPAALPIMVGSFFAILYHDYKEKLIETCTDFKFEFLWILFFISPIFLPEFLLKIDFLFQAFGVGMLLTFIFIKQSSILTKVLQIQPLVYIGQISYGLYIYQGIFLRTGPGSVQWFQQFPQQLIFTIILTVISYHTIENYFKKLRKNYL